jgi:hypothetical protein
MLKAEQIEKIIIVFTQTDNFFTQDHFESSFGEIAQLLTKVISFSALDKSCDSEVN